MIIGFVKGQQFSKKQPVIVSNSINYLEARFVFQTSDWSELVKFAHFKSGDSVYDFLLDGDTIPKEAQLNLYAGNWEVYIHGDRYFVDDDGNEKIVERITTNTQTVQVVKYEQSGSVLPEVGTSVAEQIAAVADNAKKIATSVRNEADAGAFDGKDGYTPVKSVDYFDGKDGLDGRDGVDGKTPVKGVDYWTATDKQEIVDDVLEQIEIPEGSGGSAEVPVFDLASRGVPAVTLPQGTSQVAGDMSDIVTALSKGSAIFKIPVSLNGMTISISLTMQAFTDGSGEYQCVSMALQDAMLMAIVSVNIGGIVVAVAPAVTLLGLPFVTGADNGQIMQVVNGTWTSVPVAESAVKTYVDEYLSAALEGDY